MVDIVLEPLEKFRKHSLYPQAQATVLMVKRKHGIPAARMRAYNIADAMTDELLLRKLRQEK